MYVRMCMYTGTDVRMFKYLCICMYVEYVHAYVHTYVRMYIRMCAIVEVH